MAHVSELIKTWNRHAVSCSKHKCIKLSQLISLWQNIIRDSAHVSCVLLWLSGKWLYNHVSYLFFFFHGQRWKISQLHCRKNNHIFYPCVKAQTLGAWVPDLQQDCHSGGSIIGEYVTSSCVQLCLLQIKQEKSMLVCCIHASFYYQIFSISAITLFRCLSKFQYF